MDKTELYVALEDEIKGYKKVMSDASDIIRNKDVSDFPIFAMHQQELEIGIPIAEKGKVQGNWNVHASTLEEFVSKQIIKPDNIEKFKENFKEPGDHLCVFVLSELGAQFIFVPRKS